MCITNQSSLYLLTSHRNEKNDEFQKKSESWNSKSSGPHCSWTLGEIIMFHLIKVWGAPCFLFPLLVVIPYIWQTPISSTIERSDSKHSVHTSLCWFTRSQATHASMVTPASLITKYWWRVLTWRRDSDNPGTFIPRVIIHKTHFRQNRVSECEDIIVLTSIPPWEQKSEAYWTHSTVIITVIHREKRGK